MILYMSRLYYYIVVFLFRCRLRSSLMVYFYRLLWFVIERLKI